MILKMIAKIRAGLIWALERLVIVITGVLVIDVVWQVVTRFASKFIQAVNPSTWTEELATMLLVWVSLLGAAAAFGRKGHLGVDYFVGKLGAANRRRVEILVHTITGFFAVMLVYGGWRIVTFTLLTNQVSAALGFPMGYVYLAVPISGLIILVLSLEAMIEAVCGAGQGTETGKEA